MGGGGVLKSAEGSLGDWPVCEMLCLKHFPNFSSHHFSWFKFSFLSDPSVVMRK